MVLKYKNVLNRFTQSSLVPWFPVWQIQWTPAHESRQVMNFYNLTFTQRSVRWREHKTIPKQNEEICKSWDESAKLCKDIRVFLLPLLPYRLLLLGLPGLGLRRRLASGSLYSFSKLFTVWRCSFASSPNTTTGLCRVLDCPVVTACLCYG